jgi:hypothetical protein
MSDAELRDAVSIFAFVGDLNDSGTWKLPHHEPTGKKNVVWDGVKAARGAVAGARGGVTLPAGVESKVLSHLKAHYEEFGKDFTAKEEDLSGNSGDGDDTMDQKTIEQLQGQLTEANKAKETASAALAAKDAEIAELTNQAKVMADRLTDFEKKQADAKFAIFTNQLLAGKTHSEDEMKVLREKWDKDPQSLLIEVLASNKDAGTGTKEEGKEHVPTDQQNKGETPKVGFYNPIKKAWE